MQKPDQVFQIKMLCLTRFILTIYSNTQININFHTPRPNVHTYCTLTYWESGNFSKVSIFDVKSMFFIMCLRSLVVTALERYSKDPALISPSGDSSFSRQ